MLDRQSPPRRPDVSSFPTDLTDPSNLSVPTLQTQPPFNFIEQCLNNIDFFVNLRYI